MARVAREVSLKHNRHFSRRGPPTFDYLVTAKEDRVKVENSSVGSSQGSFASVKYLLASIHQTFLSVFLPIGYPGSVAEEYIIFQSWDTIQALCSYLRGILTTQAILKGVGVGEKSATPLAAALQWVFRDGAGMLGSLVFAWWGASAFDRNIKTWRLFADVINDVGLTIEMIAPMYPKYFLLLACMASVFKAMCGVAAGSTRAALTAHFAKRGNLADVAAKENSQETAVTLLGLILGMQFGGAVGDSPAAAWTVFSLLMALHVFANLKGVRCLVLRTLSDERLRCTLQAFHAADRRAMQPRAVAKEERVFWWPYRFPGQRAHLVTEMGCRLQSIIAHSHSHFQKLSKIHVRERYILGFIDRTRVGIVLHNDATSQDMLKAKLQASFLTANTQLSPPGQALDEAKQLSAISQAYASADAQFGSFLALLENCGWETSRALLAVGDWRCDWSAGRKEE